MPKTTECDHRWIPVQTGSAWFDCLTGQIQDDLKDIEICTICFEEREVQPEAETELIETPF